MSRFSNTELSHLKWQMITQRGYSPLQADKEIDKMVEEDKKAQALAKSNANHIKKESKAKGILAPLLANYTPNARENS